MVETGWPCPRLFPRRNPPGSAFLAVSRRAVPAKRAGAALVSARHFRLMFAELAVTSDFVARAAQLGYDAVGIADHNSVAGIVRAYSAWQQLDGDKLKEIGAATRPRLLVGARLVFRDGTPDILAYPQDRAAYGRLCQLLSRGKLRAQKGECFIGLSDLLEFREGLLLIVMPPADLKNTKSVLTALGPDSWLAASMLYGGEDRRRLKQLARLARNAKVPLIAVNDVLYHDPAQRALQDIVTCIREHVTLAGAGTRLQANAERHLKSPAEMARLFRSQPEAMAETLRFARRIHFTLDELKQNYPHEPVPPGKTADRHLRDLTESGLQWRYPSGVPPHVAAQAEKEL